jgi:hypothetical protein
MNKKYVYTITVLLLFSSIMGTLLSAKKISDNGENVKDTDYSHTVFVGVAFTQTCGNCHPWNRNIHNTYSSGDYDFEYASMIVYDEEGKKLIKKAYEWEKTYGITSYPTSIFDGDFFRIVGNYPELLPSALNASGNRTVANITSNITASWLGNATINITINVKNNNESTPYNGSIRVFVTEITSRYNTSKGDPFHFGFLDFAYDENISIDAGGIIKNSTIWNGNEHGDEHGNTFGDILPHNLKVILVVYNNDTSYVDESESTLFPNNPPYEPINPYPSNESTAVDVNVDLSWMGGDPDLDPVTYDIYFGSTTTPPLIIANQSSTTYDPGLLDINSTYYWKIISWDTYNASTSSSLWHFTTRTNSAPEIPIQPIGPTNGTTGFTYEFTTRSTDPNNDHLLYLWDWGDGNFSDWIGPYPSGLNITTNYSWNQGGNYSIKVKTKDTYGTESDWSPTLNMHIVAPHLEINTLTGGLFKIKGILINNGEGEAVHVDYDINLTYGFILVGRHTSKSIHHLLPGEKVNISSRLIFGFGKTNILITVSVSNGPLYKKELDAFVFLFFISI